jgi:hypothetical protein
MNRAVGIMTIAAIITGFCAPSFGWKKEAHFLGLPIIEGAGVYSSIRMLQDSKSSVTKASAITSLCMLGTEAGLGCFAIFGPQPNYPKIRKIHRYAGFALSAAALWMSISAANDVNIKNNDRNIAHGYALVTTIPLIMFAF